MTFDVKTRLKEKKADLVRRAFDMPIGDPLRAGFLQAARDMQRLIDNYKP